ncbi:MAG: PEP-CTERM sorting domain-containing protein [Burkholderiales bacterium]|nr:PEP-CTERM sorting domain-containing protein [Burkholderiales bacterium]
MNARPRSNALRAAMALTLALLPLQPTPNALAADRGWTCGSDVWSNPACWSLGGVPQAADNVFITSADGAARTVTLDVSLPPLGTLTTYLGNFSLDALAGGAITFRQDGRDLSSGYQYVGVAGSASFLHSAGRNSVFSAAGGMLYDISDFVNGGLYLGVHAGASGTYLLSGSGDLASNSTYVGYRGSGTLNQSGGTHTSIEPLYLGYAAGASGAYVLSDGSLGTIRTFVGRQGSGMFTQSGGRHNSTEALNVSDPSGVSRYELSGGELRSALTSIGNGSFDQLAGSHQVQGLVLGGSVPATGRYTMSGGTIDANSIVVGALGHGTLRQSAGVVRVTGGLTVGDFDGTGALYELSGTGSLSASQQAIGLSSAGSFSHSGGSNTVSDRLMVGVASGVAGTYAMTAGTLRIGQDSVGPGASAVGTLVLGEMGSGTFVQSAGSVVVHGPRFGLDGIASLGRGSGGLGVYRLGGTGTFRANEVYVGHNTGTAGGTGEVEQTGGAFTAVRNLYLGGYVSASGRYTLADGTLTVGADGEFGRTLVGHAGPGTFTQTGGLHVVSGNLSIASASQAVGIYNLLAGDLTAPTVNVAVGGIGTFNQSGGAHTVGSMLSLGVGGSARARYNLSGGRLTSGILFVASGASASPAIPGVSAIFDQSGGENTVAATLHIGSGQFSSGTYLLSGGSLSTSNTAIGVVGSGLFRHSAGTHTVADRVYLGSTPGDGTYLLSGTGVLSAARLWVGHAGAGLFEQSGGTASIATDLHIGRNPDASGQYHLSGGALGADRTFVGSAVLGWAGVGLFSQTGGTHTLTRTLTIAGTELGAANPQARGIYDLAGGTLSAAGVLNFDHLNFLGGELNAPVTNHAHFSLSGEGTRSVNGAVVNHGTIKVTDTTASFPLGLENFGVYQSDPSVNRFSDFAVRAPGHLLAGTGDVFAIGNDFVIESIHPELWNTAQAQLEFIAGADAEHRLVLPAWQLGWGTLRIRSGQVLTLFGGGDLALASLILDDGALLKLNGATVHYADLDNRGMLDFSGGGALVQVPVPEPETYLLMAAGLALVYRVCRRRRAVRCAG